ncbi:MAG: iron ABC transporter permease [Clostridiales bacterium]|jgi:iron complex transport system permease protein|nr:iron ABC transporter permease [Clostridiales bacterium]
MKTKPNHFRLYEYIIFLAITLAAMLLCVCAGSVAIPVRDTLTAIWNTIFGLPAPEGISQSVIVFVRLPRVLCVALVGASLSLCGAAMQGLLRNPLADGSTLGVSSGASLGAVISIAFGITIPGIQLAGTMIMAIVFAFLSLLIILTLAYKMDFTLSTNTIILIGVIFTMFVSSIMSIIITFSGEQMKSIIFWTMGSLSGSNYSHALSILAALVVFGTVIIRYSRELNAFAIGEDNARHVGVNVKRVKLIVLIAVSALIGVSVSISGTIGFVGLVMPHMTRMVVGPNHRRLLPAAMFSGATFLMLADLVGRVLLNPLELPIGVVTSFIGSIVFVYIFYTTRKAG